MLLCTFIYCTGFPRGEYMLVLFCDLKAFLQLHTAALQFAFNTWLAEKHITPLSCVRNRAVALLSLVWPCSGKSTFYLKVLSNLRLFARLKLQHDEWPVVSSARSLWHLHTPVSVCVGSYYSCWSDTHSLPESVYNLTLWELEFILGGKDIVRKSLFKF